MDRYYNDEEFMMMVNDILNNEEFQKLKSIKHHESNRFDHSIRVAYKSYEVAQKLNFNVKDVTRAAMLHDFFIQENEGHDKKYKRKMMINHPKYALENAKKYYEINNMQEDIILSHMFPVNFNIPKYKESWVVDYIDDVVSIQEKGSITSRYIVNAVSFIVIFIFCVINSTF